MESKLTFQVMQINVRKHGTTARAIYLNRWAGSETKIFIKNIQKKRVI